MVIVSQANGGSSGAILFDDLWTRPFQTICIKSRVFFAYDLLQKRDRAMRMVSLCSAGQDASIDMHIDLLRSPVDLKASLRSNFDLNILGSTNIYFDAFRRGSMMAFELLLYVFFVQKLFTKSHLAV